MTAYGPEAVKADLVDHITDNIADWVAVTAVDSWPPAPAYVAATDLLPVDEDKPWPCVLIACTGQTAHVNDGGSTQVVHYAVTVKAAVRSSTSKDVDGAAAGRDRLAQALWWLLIVHPEAATGTTVLAADMTMDLDPVGLDPKSRPVAVGVIKATVRRVETLPDLDSYGTADSALASVSVTDADGTLYSEGSGDLYDIGIYDDTRDYEGGHTYLPKE